MAAIKNSLLLLLVLLHSSTSVELQGNGRRRLPPPPPPPSPPPNWGVFDYYTFALQWSTSLCNQMKPCATTSPSSFPKEFTIHGLWPSMNNRSSPVITPLLGRLSNQWPNAKTYQAHDPTNATNYIDFWSYEWGKHGAAITESIHDYFDSALDLHDTLRQGLRQVVGYNKRFIRRIKAKFGASPKVMCNYWGINEQIYELQFEFDLSLKLMNASRGNCSSNSVLIP